MNYNFPRAKFVDENDIAKQANHVDSEMCEVAYACGENDFYEEMADAWHSMETFWRIVAKEKGGCFVQDTINKVIDKNEKRGYYERSKV